MSVDILRVDPNERVDVEDFEFVSESIQDHERQLVGKFLCDPARTRKWVISGFDMSNPVGSQLQVTRGKAILAQRLGGTVEYGVIATEGDATQTVDLSGYGAGTYGIYVRFERIPDESQSRIFWDPSGSGSEYSQTINTRYAAGWSLRVEASSPGDDWLYIGDVVAPGMSITKKREFFWEGNEYDAGSGSWLSGWSIDGGGVANDRSATREDYGITDLQMFTAATRQCLEDLKGRGLRAWYARDIGGMNIGFDADPNEDRLAVGDANFYLENLAAGDPQIVFDSGEYVEYDRTADALYPGSTMDLGKSTDRWDNVYAAHLNLGTGAGQGVTTDILPGGGGLDLGSAGAQWDVLYLAGDANIDGDAVIGTDANIAGGLNVGGSVDPAAGEGIFSKGISVGVDTTPASDTIYLGAITAGMAYTSATSSLLVKADSDNYIALLGGATDAIDFYVGGSGELHLDADGLEPTTDSGLALGNSSKHWSEVHAVDVRADDVYGATLLHSPGARFDSLTDPGGAASTVTLSGVLGTGSAGDGAVANAGSNDSTGWLKIYVGTTVCYIPYWTTIT